MNVTIVLITRELPLVEVLMKAYGSHQVGTISRVGFADSNFYFDDHMMFSQFL